MTDHNADPDIVEPIDIAVEHQGTIVLLVPQTASARSWLTANVDPDAPRWAGAVAAEERYAVDILTGAVLDGLLVAPR